MQPARSQAMADSAPPQPQLQQLVAGDDPVLTRRERSDLPVTRSTSSTHVVLQIRHPAHRRQVERRTRAKHPPVVPKLTRGYAVTWPRGSADG